MAVPHRRWYSSRRVKHLNPRQGITSQHTISNPQDLYAIRVKHLNPRQGITRCPNLYRLPNAFFWCETPKSPPGDYKPAIGRLIPIIADEV